MGNLDFIEDRENVQPVSMDYEPLAPGRYAAMVIESELVTTQSGGLMLKCTWEILEESFKGRRVWGNFNLKNDNPKAETIGRGQLSALSKATGLPSIPDSSEKLHNRSHMIKLEVETSEGYKPKNVIKGYFSSEKNMPASVVVAPTSASAPGAEDIFGGDNIPL